MCGCKEKTKTKKRIKSAQKRIEELERKLKEFSEKTDKKIQEALVFYD